MKKIEKILEITFMIAGILYFLSFIMGNETNKYDVNNDGFINARDYEVIKDYIMSEEDQRYDVNDDGAIDAVDYVKVYKYIMANTK